MNEQTISPSCRIRVYLLGPLEVARRTFDSWQVVSKDEWGKYRKAGRRILGRLLAAPGRRAGQGRLLDDLWPETDSQGNLNNGLTAIRNVIGEDLLTTIDVFYEIAGQDLVWVDLDACKALLKEAENRGCTTFQAMPLLEEALSYLERGECFEGEEGQWRYGLQAEPDAMLRQCRWWLAQGYEQQGKIWQAGEQYRALCATLPLNEEALQRWMAMLCQQGKTQEAHKCFQDVKNFVERQGLGLSKDLEQVVSRLSDAPSATSGSYDTPIALSRRSVLGLGAGAIVEVTDKLAGLWADDLLAVYERGIVSCQSLYWNGNPHHVETFLPLYCSQTALLARQPSSLQKPAARLASLAQQLTCELLTDREDFGAAEQAGREALLYAQVAHDVNLQVASLVGLANLGFHRKLSTYALWAYEQAIALFNECVTPLLKGRVYAGIAEVYAMRGQAQEAMQAVGLAYEHYPMKPEDDPAYSYLRASRYSLYVFGDAQSRLFLKQPKEAEKALIAMQKETNDPEIEPVTKLDLLYYQAETQVQQKELEASSTVLTEAAMLARNLGSRLYFNKLAVTYHDLRVQWPHESLVTALDEVFQPW
jgi:tetratricopeptide (TPR) repeat protein